MDGVLQRSLVPCACVGIIMIALHQTVAELRNPLGAVLLVVTAVLLALRPIERQIRTNSHFRTRVLVVGNRPFVQKFIDEIERFPRSRYSVVGVVEETEPGPMRRSPYLVLGTIGELQTIVRAVKPDRIVLALSDRRGRMPIADLMDFQAGGIVVEELADAYERVSGKLPIELITPGQLITSQRLTKSRALRIAQRIFSFTAALVLLILFAPLMLLIAVAIKVDSRGPSLFRPTRLGKGCRPFQLIKFRTMQPVDRPPSEWVKDNVERITRVGKWLRKLRLDELPQLINVLLGHMNLVGPRPHPVGNLQLFRDSIPYYQLRGSVLPGITGWAQVRYHYANNLQEETEKMRYDLYYIKHMSLWMDFAILLRTCGVFVSSLLSPAPSELSVPKGMVAVGPSRLPIRDEAMPRRAATVMAIFDEPESSERRRASSTVLAHLSAEAPRAAE